MWIIEATDPADPEVVATLPDVPGAHSNDIKVLTDVSTDAFQGDLLAHSIEPCGAAFGTHNLYLFPRPDLGATYSATVFNQSNLAQDGSRGVVQMVDVSDPDDLQLVSEWELADAEGQGGPPFDELCQRRGDHLPSCNLHDVWVSDDGTILYASYWDAGLVLLDVSDPPIRGSSARPNRVARTTRATRTSPCPTRSTVRTT